MKKKAVTPLVSILLLIFFALGLGILVISWGNTYEDTHLAPQMCEEAALQLIEVNQEQLCKKNPTLTLENIGSERIKSVKISFITLKEVNDERISFSIEPAQIKNLELDKTEAQKLKITPIINNDYPCPKSGIETKLIDCE